MRQDLVDWMSCQHGMLELSDETFHLALRYLDTFLLRRGPENFLARNGAGSEPRPPLPLGALPCDRALYLDGSHQPLCNKLKRLGITCVFVAAKVVEMCAPPAGEFAHAAEVSTFSRRSCCWRSARCRASWSTTCTTPRAPPSPRRT